MNRHLATFFLCLLSTSFVFAQDAPEQDEEQNNLNVTAERMEILLESAEGRVIELTDNVRFEDNSMTLTADRMKIFLADEAQKKEDKQKEDKKDGSSMTLKRIEADGNVHLRKKIDANDSAAGARAVYDTEKDVVTLSGDCVIRQQGHTMKGQEVLFDRKQQKISVKGAEVRIQLNKGQNKGLGDFLNKSSEGKNEDVKREEVNQQAVKNEEVKVVKPEEVKPEEVKPVEPKPEVPKQEETKPAEEKKDAPQQPPAKPKKRGFFW